MKFLSGVLTLCLLAAPVFADADGETEAAKHTAEVDAVIETATELLEEARQTVPTDRPSALRAYLLLREADAAVTRALAAHPEAGNLSELKAHPAAQLQDGPIATAARQVVSRCEGHPPRDCLFAEAERIVAQIVRKSEFASSRALPLSNIAAERAKVGQLAEATRLWTEAERFAAQHESAIYRASELQVIAGARADAGQFAEAERIAARIKEPSYRASAFCDIAGAQAKAENMAEATRLWAEVEQSLAQIESASSEASALVYFVGSLAKAGQLAEAEDIVTRITDSRYRAPALADIAGARTKAGQFAEAERIAKRISRASYRALALSDIAGAQARAGNMAEATRLWEEAEQTTAEINRSEAWASALSHMARTRAAAGQSVEATRLWSEAERIIAEPERRLGRPNRSFAFYRIAGSLAEAGQFAEAERIAVQIEDSLLGWSLRDIAGLLAEAGKYAEAERIAALLAPTGKLSQYRAEALSLIASEL